MIATAKQPSLSSSSDKNIQRGITVVQRYEEYCVLQVTRGVGGPQELLKWLRGQEESNCFTVDDAKTSGTAETATCTIRVKYWVRPPCPGF